MRRGPLRVAVIANVDQAQADAAVRAVDRWIARRPGEARSCPPVASLAATRAGTYSIDLPPGARSEAVLAVPLSAGNDASLAAATWLASALDGPDGLLAHALGNAGAGGVPLARATSVSVARNPRSPALTLGIVADDASLDASVAQTRALLDRLRQGALREEDRARAAKALTGGSLEPGERAIALWRGSDSSSAPSLDALRAFAAAALRDDALVIVAARPPRGLPQGHPGPGHELSTKSREPGPPR
jgi:hypothetical protein